ncbi:arylesterase [Candidatus Woesearchaeota archaeon]|nr:arylesterase [Candidatus Woesearchaeota archaeon]
MKAMIAILVLAIVLASGYFIYDNYKDVAENVFSNMSMKGQDQEEVMNNPGAEDPALEVVEDPVVEVPEISKTVDNSSEEVADDVKDIVSDDDNGINLSTIEPNVTDAIQIEEIEDPIKHYKIVALGDSLTEGFGLNKSDAYPAQLELRLNNAGYNVTVINQGISGERSDQILARVQNTIDEKPDIVILTIGANDAFASLPTSQIKDNIAMTVEELQDNGIMVILGGMQVLGDVDLSALADYLVNDLGISEQYANMLVSTMNYVDDFKSIYPEIAEEYDLQFITFFLQGVAGNSQLNQDDGIHPTKEGYSYIIENNILPVLEPMLV